jgi:RNA-directed DNA polymerase
VAAHRRHEWLLHAVEQRRREALMVLQVPLNEEKRRTVDLARGATCSCLGVDLRRVKSRRGVWRPWDTPMRKKRTALLRKVQDIVRRYESHPVDRVIDLINPMLRGWVCSCAVGDSSRGCGFIKDGVEKTVRRHLRRARHRKGFGGKRWRRRWLYATLRLLNHSRGSRPQPKALPVREVPEPFTGNKPESAGRESRTRRVTWRERETWLWWNCEPTEQAKEFGWKPST